MALPATDNFDRADGGLGANWTNLTEEFRVVGNRVQPLSDITVPASLAIWSADLVALDHYGQLTCAVLGQQMVCPVVRASAGNNWYWLTLVETGDFNDMSLTLYRSVAGSTVLLQQSSPVLAGAILKLSIVGTLIKCYRDGVQQGFDVTDSTLSTGGPGLASWLLAGMGDDWECGDISTEPIEQDLMSIRQRMI